MQTTADNPQEDFTKVNINSISQNGSSRSSIGTLVKHEIGFNTVYFVLASKDILLDTVSGNIEFEVKDANGPLPGQIYHYQITDWPGRWYAHPDTNVDVIIFPYADIAEALKQQSLEVETSWVNVEELANSNHVLEAISGQLGGKWY